ncbi:unnamed protein product [Prorocentrum cordatum]|uniref:Uncharacterized protein n=1 Tax=Prorocentrum cordatum TaxID=2364126 RepID=A0ABN9VWU1_9DINO|nr:unnamed protein product [Polarella glacialis]
MELEAGRLQKQARGRVSADAGKGKGKKEGRAQGEKRTDSNLVDDEALPVVLKLPLNLGARARQQEAATLTTLIAPAGLQPVLLARKRAKGWDEVVQEARAEAKPEAEIAKRGAISLARAVGLADGPVKEGEAVGRANSMALTEMRQHVDSLSMDAAPEIFTTAKVSSAYKETDVKIQLNVNAQTTVIANYLEQLGAVRERGAAPMSHLERILHTGLNTHNMK